MDNFDNNDEIDLIIYVLSHKNSSLKVKGIGDKIATAIAIFYETLDNFLDANFLTLGNITNVNGKHIVPQSKITNILESIKKIPKGYSVRETWIRVIVRDFLHKQMDMMSDLSLNTLTINPFLVRALEMDSPTEVIKFNLYQHVTRSVVTSWGFDVQNILRYSGSKNISESDSGFDIRKAYQDMVYYIQIKSSPDSMNRDMVRRFKEKLIEIENKSDKYKPFLGITFGLKEQVSEKITTDIPEEKILVGKELWDLISDETDFHCKVLDAISEVTGGILPKNFSEMIDEKFEELLSEWLDKYGDGKKSVDKVVNDSF